MPKEKPEQIRIEYVPLDEVQRWPRNPKKHDTARLKDAIVRHGFVAPVIRDEATGKLVAGHGRLDALLELREAGAEAPKRIVVRKGAWLVPTVCGVAFASEKEAEDYLLSDNRLVELGGWDNAALVAILKDEQRNLEEVAQLGWSNAELQRMVSELDATVSRGKTPGELLEGFSAGVIKQIVLYFKAQEFEGVLDRMEAVMQQEKVDDMTAAFLKMLEFYERGHAAKTKKAG